MDTQGHLVDKEETNSKTNPFIELHINFQQVFSELNWHTAPTERWAVVFYFMLGATKNRLTNTPLMSGNSILSEHLIVQEPL